MMRTLQKSPDITAVFGVNVSVAAGALLTLREQGIRVPERMSVISIHDAPLAELVDPPLTTVPVPLFNLGYEAARLLVHLVEQTGEATGQMLPAESLVRRGSTAPPAAAQPPSRPAATRSRKK